MQGLDALIAQLIWQFVVCMVCFDVRRLTVLPYGYLFFFFFFQAEDGIRDLTVTGVQTCALPISRPARRRGPGAPGHGGVQSPCGLHESRGLRARAARDAPGEWAALVAPDHADRKSVV